MLSGDPGPASPHEPLPLAAGTIDEYQLVVNVNLTGFFLVTQRVIDGGRALAAR